MVDSACCRMDSPTHGEHLSAHRSKADRGSRAWCVAMSRPTQKRQTQKDADPRAPAPPRAPHLRQRLDAHQLHLQRPHQVDDGCLWEGGTQLPAGGRGGAGRGRAGLGRGRGGQAGVRALLGHGTGTVLCMGTRTRRAQRGHRQRAKHASTYCTPGVAGKKAKWCVPRHPPRG